MNRTRQLVRVLPTDSLFQLAALVQEKRRIKASIEYDQSPSWDALWEPVCAELSRRGYDGDFRSKAYNGHFYRFLERSAKRAGLE